MNHITEIASAAALLAAAVGGALIVLPRPKPEPLPIVLEVEPKAAVQAQPRTDAQRIEALQRELGEIAAEQRRLAREIRALSMGDGDDASLRQRRESHR
jgi:hypothetical protein